MKLPAWLRAIHFVIIANLVLQVAYGFAMVFFVVTGGAGKGPLFGAAGALPFETMVTRRLYASETWIAIVGLSLYVGLTEILPRRLRA